MDWPIAGLLGVFLVLKCTVWFLAFQCFPTMWPTLGGCLRSLKQILVEHSWKFMKIAWTLQMNKPLVDSCWDINLASLLCPVWWFRFERLMPPHEVRKPMNTRCNNRKKPAWCLSVSSFLQWFSSKALLGTSNSTITLAQNGTPFVQSAVRLPSALVPIWETYRDQTDISRRPRKPLDSVASMNHVTFGQMPTSNTFSTSLLGSIAE